jgi:cysteine-rich repeat protein
VWPEFQQIRDIPPIDSSVCIADLAAMLNRIVSFPRSFLWAVLFVASAAYPEEKVMLCHYPPGNPNNPQNILVGEAAVNAHLRHGDQAGPCPDGCQVDPSICDDGNSCTSDSCDANAVCLQEPVNCDDSDFCTDDSCDPVAGCTYSPTTTPPEAGEVSCNDGLDNDCDRMVDAADSDCAGFCGDGIVQPPEQCDDGNPNPFDGCDRCIIVDITPD